MTKRLFKIVTICSLAMTASAAFAEDQYQLCKIQGSTRWHIIESSSPELAAKIASAKLALSNALGSLKADQGDKGISAGRISDNIAYWSQSQMKVSCTQITALEVQTIQQAYSNKNSLVTLFSDADLVQQMNETQAK